MRAEQAIQPEFKDVFKVAAWKWGIDGGSPRWRQLYFNWIFLPFLNFSHKLGIPAPKEKVVETDDKGRQRVIFRWFEDEGIFEHEDQADVGCLDEHWCYTNLPFGRLMPPGSGSYGVTIFPRKKNPKDKYRWAKQQFPFLIKDRKQDEQMEAELAERLARLNQVLDQ